MVREIKFKGKSEEEMKNIEMSEFIKLVGARQRRSLTRGLTEEKKIFMKKVSLAKQGKYSKRIKTHCRDMVVVPDMLGLPIFVYNGKAFEEVRVTMEMLGHYLGEYVFTRGKVKHSAPGIGATKSSASASVK
tara:strand:- start:128 stop:523 length:396 start_codon:yes stop_codon:yes gene_type:complete